jgi:hypothetical protein
VEAIITRCTDVEALEILRHPTVMNPLGMYSESILDSFEWWMIDGKLLVATKPDNDSVEVHIACKLRDRSGARQSIKDGLIWLTGRGFSTIWTTAPDERKALVNMLKSLQFRKMGNRWIYGH